jgi:hypothetical protein
MWKSNMSRKEAADLIERFLSDSGLYPQEWNDFVETRQEDRTVERYRKRCEELDPCVNYPGVPKGTAVAELRSIIRELQSPQF